MLQVKEVGIKSDVMYAIQNVLRMSDEGSFSRRDRAEVHYMTEFKLYYMRIEVDMLSEPESEIVLCSTRRDSRGGRRRRR